jgi:hypothetical protein
VDFEDIGRIREEEFEACDDDLVHLGVASIGVEYSNVWQREFENCSATWSATLSTHHDD